MSALKVAGLSNTAPYFPAQLLSPVADAGASVNLTNLASGTLPLNYQWLFNGAPMSNATNAILSIANAQATNTGDYSVIATNSSGIATSSVVSVIIYPPQATVFSDDFETNSAANWIVNNSSSNNAVGFSFDYSTLGIPSAPHSTGGTTHGVQMKANLTLGVCAALSISPTEQIFNGDYRLHFDGWINVNGPFPGGGTGSTEFLTAGIGTAGNRSEWPTNANADGHYFSVDGDGGVSSSSPTFGDYSGYTGKNWHNAASGIYAAGSLDNANTYYSSLFPSGQAAPALQQADFAQQTGSLNSGTFGLAWHDVIVSKRGSTVDWVIDGVRIATITNASFTASNVFVGFWDPFASLSDNNTLSFGLVDNVRVEVPALAPVLDLQPGATFRLMGSGQTGATYILETSTDLTDWTTLTSLTATNRAFEYNFIPPAGDAQHFFRARLGP